MKKLDVFAIGIGATNVFLFFQFIDIARQIVGLNYIPQKRPLSLVIGILLAISISHLLFNLGKFLKCVEIDDENEYKTIIGMVGRKTIVLLTLFLITTMIQNFFLYR